LATSSVNTSVNLALRTAACLALAVTAGCGASSAASPQRHASGAATSAVPIPANASGTAAASPPGGHGELAFIARGKLYLLGGPAGGPRLVTLPGIPYAPAWSPDHRWLAVEVSKPPPASQPYLQMPEALWLVSAGGTGTRRLTPTSWQVSGFAWAPERDELAVVAYLPQAPQTRSYLVGTAEPTGTPRILATGDYSTGPAWSPDGARIAVGFGTFTGGQYHSRLDVLGLTGGPAAVVTATTANVLDLAGWWPDGSGLLYWFDFQGSGSIAADGLPLDSIAFGARGSRVLVGTMLVHASWLAFSPRGNAVAAVSGGDRVIWSGGKRITLCSAAGTCTPVAQPADVVSLDPSWSPDGTEIAFARLSASGPFGPNGRADFSPYWITRWEATSRLWIASADGSGARPLAAAGRGAVDPTWGSDGSLLFVRNDSLWLLPAGAGAATRLTGTLGAISGLAYYLTYYAYVPYPQLFAWTLSPQPAMTAQA
jgi:Tol biopolymer transport system component